MHTIYYEKYMILCLFRLTGQILILDIMTVAGFFFTMSNSYVTIAFCCGCCCYDALISFWAVMSVKNVNE